MNRERENMGMEFNWGRARRERQIMLRKFENSTVMHISLYLVIEWKP